MPHSLEFLNKVAKIAYDHDMDDMIDFRYSEENGLYPSVNCNDFFFWATADCVDITPDNVGIFEAALRDAKEAGAFAYGALLFCARVQGMRPQGAAYPDDREIWPLFDACGPERELDMFNPHRSHERTIKPWQMLFGLGRLIEKRSESAPAVSKHDNSDGWTKITFPFKSDNTDIQILYRCNEDGSVCIRDERDLYKVVTHNVAANYAKSRVSEVVLDILTGIA